jgi:hypothetical protein
MYIAAEAIEAELEMTRLLELMEDNVISLSPDYRESKFELYML